MTLRCALLAAAVACAGLFSQACAQEARSAGEIAESLRGGDIASAVRRARELAETDDLEAQHNLALFYWNGVAIPQNFEEAMRWSTLAAVRGHKKAPAVRHRLAKSLDPSFAEKAMEWARARLTMTAEAGDDSTLISLSRSYAPEFGFGSDKEAYFWAVLAVSAGRLEARRDRDSLGARLSAAEVARIQARAREWFGRFRKDRA